MVAQIEELMQSVEVGERFDVEQLSFFPLSCKRKQRAKDVAVLEDGIKSGRVVVTEIGDEGNVPEVFIENHLEGPLFILEGEEIVGAKQNRVFNISMFISAAANLKVPVSCVEAGRWHRRSKVFTSGARASTRVRRNMSKSVSYSVRQGNPTMCSDQSQVWSDVRENLLMCEAPSETSALADAYEKVAGNLEKLLTRIKFPKDCMGVAVAVGGKLVGLEILGNANLWRRHEERILRSFAIDALNAPIPKRRPGQSAVYKIIQKISSIEDQTAPSAGSGTQHRMESEKLSASALEVGDCVYHFSAII